MNTTNPIIKLHVLALLDSRTILHLTEKNSIALEDALMFFKKQLSLYFDEPKLNT